MRVSFRRRKLESAAKCRRPRAGLYAMAAAWAGLALSGCHVLDYSRADGGLGAQLAQAPAGAAPWEVSGGDDKLARLGAEQSPRILAAYGGEYHDVKLERMVAKIVGRLTAVSDNPGQTYQVVILDSPNINAFALPGGYVYVTRGLLALANDSAEVAAVIAHEMEHINANHGLARRDKEQEIAISDRVANEVLAGPSRDETLIRGRLNLARFSREQELAADQGGLRMVAAAGYDPFASPRFLQTMEEYSRFRDISGAQDAGLDFLSNHPSTPQRVRLALAAARKISAPGVGDIDRAAFLRGIDGVIFGDNIAANGFYIRGRTFMDSHIGLSFTAPAGFQLSYKDNAVTAAGPNDTALRFDTAPLNAGAEGAADPAAYIAGGWISGLDKSSIKRRQLAGLPAAQAVAQNGKWRFNVLVLLDKNRAYRFLAAAPKNGADPAAITLAAAQSFRLLSAQEKAAIKPLRVRIATVQAGDTVESLAAAQPLDDRGAALFRILNGLGPNQSIRPGEQVKLILP